MTIMYQLVLLRVVHVGSSGPMTYASSIADHADRILQRLYGATPH